MRSDNILRYAVMFALMLLLLLVFILSDMILVANTPIIVNQNSELLTVYDTPADTN